MMDLRLLFFLLIPLFARAQAPNILIVLADDLNWREMSPYFGQPGGHPVGAMPGVLTPNMDTLASQGVRLDRCFNSTPMCAPLRQSLYTGISPVRNGAYPNHGEVKVGTKSIAHHLADLGYRVGLMGKQHFGPASSFPFEILGASTGKDRSENPANIAAAQEFITRDANQPYCLIIASDNPHREWDHGDYVGNNLTLPIPGDAADTPEFRAEFNKYLKEVKVFDQEVGFWMTQAANGPNPNNTLFICLSEQGAALPGAKWNVYNLGTRTGALIRWPDKVTSGTTSNALIEIIDFLPTFIEAAGGTQPTGLERLDGRSFLDVLVNEKATHKKYAFSLHTTTGVTEATPGGYAIRAVTDGEYTLVWNLQHEKEYRTLGVVYEPFPSWQDLAVNGATAAEREHAQVLVDRMLNRPEYQFFDNTADPFQLTNRVDEVQFQGRITEMKTALEDWMAQQGDRGILTEQGVETDLQAPADEVMPYMAWVRRHAFTFLAEADPTLDPDNDQRSNLVEWLGGTDPFTADAEPGLRLLSQTPGSTEGETWLDLTMERPSDWPGTNSQWTVQSGDLLDVQSWTPVQDATETDFRLDTHPWKETFTLRVPTSGHTQRNLRVQVTVPTGMLTLPPPAHSAELQAPVDLGDLSTTLDEQDLTLTLRTTLPPQAPGANQGRVLFGIGAAKGVSLVLLNDTLVLSASAGASGGSPLGETTLSGTLNPADFGKQITLRVVLDHRASSSDLSLSWNVQGGSAGRLNSGNLEQTGYIGSFSAGVGGLATVEGVEKITGITNTPFGPLATLPNGLNDLQDWDSFPIRYEIIQSTGSPLAP